MSNPFKDLTNFKDYELNTLSHWIQRTLMIEAKELKSIDKLWDEYDGEIGGDHLLQTMAAREWLIDQLVALQENIKSIIDMRQTEGEITMFANLPGDPKDFVCACSNCGKALMKDDEIFLLEDIPFCQSCYFKVR